MTFIKIYVEYSVDFSRSYLQRIRDMIYYAIGISCPLNLHGTKDYVSVYLRKPSKHPFLTPIGTDIKICVEDFLMENGVDDVDFDTYFTFEVISYSDAGNDMYMYLWPTEGYGEATADQFEDDRARLLAEAFIDQGWELYDREDRIYSNSQHRSLKLSAS